MSIHHREMTSGTQGVLSVLRSTWTILNSLLSVFLIAGLLVVPLVRVRRKATRTRSPQASPPPSLSRIICLSHFGSGLLLRLAGAQAGVPQATMHLWEKGG